MSKRKTLKETITEAVLKEIPKVYRTYHESSTEQLLTKWWLTGRQEGLRLTEMGMTAFTLAEIEFYDYEFVQDGQSYYAFISDLNKKIKCPYYLGVNKINKSKKFYIRLYDSKIAMLLGIYGTLQEYLNSIEVKR